MFPFFRVEIDLPKVAPKWTYCGFHGPSTYSPVRNLEAVITGRWAGIPEGTPYPKPEGQGRLQTAKSGPNRVVFISLYKLPSKFLFQ